MAHPNLQLGDRSVWYAVILALALRVAAVLFDHFVFPLPGGSADAKAFEMIAWQYSQDLISILSFDRSMSYLFTIPLSFVYALTGRYPIVLQMISVAFGTLGVYLTWRLAADIWGTRVATLAPWAIAVFPMSIVYSALILREVYISAFFLLGLIYVVRWCRSNSLLHAFIASFHFGVCTLLHGGMLISLVSFFFVIFVFYFGRLLESISGRRKVDPHSAMMLIPLFGIIVAFLAINPTIPKIGKITGIFDFELIRSVLSIAMRGDASYPEWLLPTYPVELLWILPLRVLYLLFAPFPWDIRSPEHLIGLVDATLYALIAACIFGSRQEIFSRSEVKIVAIITICVIVAFAVGTGNFGTALRHREKIVEVLVILAAPFLYRFAWRNQAP